MQKQMSNFASFCNFSQNILHEVVDKYHDIFILFSYLIFLRVRVYPEIEIGQLLNSSFLSA